MLNVELEEWVPGQADLYVARHSHSSCAVKETAYFFGGWGLRKGQNPRQANIRNEIELLKIRHELSGSYNTDDIDPLSLVTDFIISGLTARMMSLMVTVDSSTILILGGADK